MRPSILVDGVAKSYRLYQSPWHRAAELVVGRRLHRPSTVLRDVSFELRPGERLGIVGENGAGKSTLLKILAGVTTPSAGRVAVVGRVASILELGSGFHPELTGRQNVALNAAMLGLSASDLERLLPDIVSFSELGEYIDQPVKAYSTGMSMRLAFSIATQVEPDVLIIDEALSVGDGYFQKKCLDRILELCDERRILLFCSHAMYYVTSLCGRALWLRRGEVAALGPALDVVRAYESFLQEKDKTERPQTERAATSPARLREVRQRGGGGRAPGDDPWGLEVEWESDDPSLSFHLAVGIDRADGIQVCSFATNLDRLPAYRGRRRYRVELEVPRLPIQQGTFSLHVFLLDGEGLHVYDQEVVAEAFSLQTDIYRPGLIEVEHRWHDDPLPRQRAGTRRSAISA